MAMESRRSLRGLTLMVLVPCLLFSAVISGWITYRDLYRVILNDGFEMKLDAVSSGVAAFIDGADHAELGRVRTVTGVAADPSNPILWGIETGLDELVTVDMVSGSAVRAGPLPVEGLHALVYDVPAGQLVANVSSSGDLVSWTPGRLDWVSLGTIEPGAHDLAITADASVLIAAGPWGLHGYSRDAEGFSLTWSIPDRIRAVAISPRSGRLFALAGDGTLLVADTPGGTLEAAGEFTPFDEYTDPGELLQIGSLTASPLTDKLLGAASQLLALDPDELTVDVEEFRRGYRDQSGITYMRYVEPMRRIRSALDITYLYTQNLVPGDSIQYILDSTPLGDDHSPIGTREALESDTDIQGLEGVVDRGAVYSSGIEDSEDWGLLKSAYAPINLTDGGNSGMVGTDISVSTIQDRTQIALAKVGLVTIVVLFLGGLGSILISLRLTGPLAAVQEGASRVAAGRMGHLIETPRLRDLAALTTSFNEMTQTLTSAVDELGEETERVESMRSRRHLIHELATRARRGRLLPAGMTVGLESGDREVGMPARLLVVGPRELPIVVALLDEWEDPLEALAEREELAALSERIVEARGSDPEALVEALTRYRSVDEGSLLVIQATSRTVWVVGKATVDVRLSGSTSGVKPKVAPGAPLQVPVGAQATFSLGLDLPTGGKVWELQIEKGGG